MRATGSAGSPTDSSPSCRPICLRVRFGSLMGMSWTIPNLVISFVHLRHRQHRRILPAASASERFVGIDQRMKAGPDGNHGFLLRRAVRIRQSAWGVAPRRLTRRPVFLTILAVIKLTPSRRGSRGSIATDVKKLVGYRAAIVRVALGV
jgi:hypothetical protein